MIEQLIDELKEWIIDSIKTIFVKSKYIILILIILMSIFCIFVLKKYPASQIDSKELLLFDISISNWLNWITLITIPVTAVWAIYQYKKSIKIRQQERAAEIAKLFSDELLDKCTIIWEIIEISDLNDILKLRETDMNNLERFDLEEILTLYKNEEDFLEKYESTKSGKHVQSCYLYILETRISMVGLTEIVLKNRNIIIQDIKKIMSAKYSEAEIENLENKHTLKSEFEKYMIANNTSAKDLRDFYRKTYSNEEAYKLFKLENKSMPFHFVSLIDDVLNELEYISMYISSQSAGSKFVYQSLHQVFLRTVKALAVEIALRNKNYTDKYYTNIIHVYKKWSAIRLKYERREKKNKKKAYKYLEPKIEKI